MKRLLALFLLSAAAMFAGVATLDLGSHGSITLYLPDGWDVATTNMAGTATMEIKPKNDDVNATCTLAITFPDTDHFDTRQRLKMQVEADNRAAAEQAVERKAVAQEFNVKTGFGFYVNITDPDLRGKPPEKGNYKNASIGKIRLAPDVLIDVSIMADGFTSDPYQALLGAVEGMDYKPR